MQLGIQDILRTLPHRYPFLLVDRILELEPGKRVIGIKNVTFNEEFFQGHFPGNPVMRSAPPLPRFRPRPAVPWDSDC